MGSSEDYKYITSTSSLYYVSTDSYYIANQTYYIGDSSLNISIPHDTTSTISITYTLTVNTSLSVNFYTIDSTNKFIYVYSTDMDDIGFYYISITYYPEKDPSIIDNTLSFYLNIY